MRTRRLPGTTSEVVAFCASLAGPTKVAYEAGPTGYGLARALHAAGIGCVVAAPGKIERPAQDRVKTDQRDGERVLRLLMIDGLHAVRVPSCEEEALRDLVRAREALRGDLMRGRQRLSKLLLRHDVIYEDTASAWTARHRVWLRKLDLGGGAQLTLLDYLHAIDAMVIRRNALQTAIGELVPGSPWAQPVARLRCLRGIDTLSAVGLCAEVGDFDRFDKAGRLMSYLGLVPSENSSGETRRQGDHEDRLTSRPPAAGRGRLALPQATRPRQGAAAPPSRPTRARPHDRLAGPTAPAPRLAAPGW
jgi:transposase